MEKSVIVHPETIITKDHDTVSIPALQINMNYEYCCYCSPSEKGQIDAKLIRILPLDVSSPLGSRGSSLFHDHRD